MTPDMPGGERMEGKSRNRGIIPPTGGKKPILVDEDRLGEGCGCGKGP